MKRRRVWIWVALTAFAALIALTVLVGAAPSPELRAIREVAARHDMRLVDPDRPWNDDVWPHIRRMDLPSAEFAREPAEYKEFERLASDVAAALAPFSISAEGRIHAMAGPVENVVTVHRNYGAWTSESEFRAQVVLDHQSEQKAVLYIAVWEKRVTLGERIKLWFRGITGGP